MDGCGPGGLQPPLASEADEATNYWTEYYRKGQQFRHLGISRESFTFGVSSQVNTAVNPFRFAEDANDRLTVNFDAGRPWEVDVKSLKLKTPIGKLVDWKGQLPAHMQYIFPLNSSTAHPSFDPNTKEFFTVNFVKDFDVLMGHDKLQLHIMKNPAVVEEWLEEKLDDARRRLGDDPQQNKEHMRRLFEKAHLGVARKLGLRVWLWQVLFSVLERIYQFFLPMGNLFAGGSFPRNGVHLLRWTGSDTVDSWEVLDDATGQPLTIEETMHQTNYTRDYIVLIDSAIKFAYDIWGETVNLASRMETHSRPGRINISESLFQLAKHEFACTAHGELTTKDGSRTAMYWVEGEIK